MSTLNVDLECMLFDIQTIKNEASAESQVLEIVAKFHTKYAKGLAEVSVWSKVELDEAIETVNNYVHPAACHPNPSQDVLFKAMAKLLHFREEFRKQTPHIHPDRNKKLQLVAKVYFNSEFAQDDLDSLNVAEVMPHPSSFIYYTLAPLFGQHVNRGVALESICRILEVENQWAKGDKQ